MSKTHTTTRRLRHRLENASLRAAIAVLGIVPAKWHGAVARAVASVLVFVPWRRSVLNENLQTALGEMSPRRRRDLTKGIIRHSAGLLLELAWMSRIEPGEIAGTVEIDSASRERVDRCLAAGKGIIFAGAHLGNWEWLGAWYAQAIGPMGAVYKPMHNSGTDAYITGLRARFGLDAFSTREPSQRRLVSCLKRGGAVGILSDQDARRRGRFVPFFGRPASTATGMATLAIRFGSPILPSFNLRDGTGRLRAIVGEPLWPDQNADPQAEELRLLRGYHEALEKAIMQDPAQYFWWHRRWKTKPKA